MLRIKTELDKLEEYLINHRITYDRIDEDAAHDETGRYLLHHARHQICVPCKPEDGERRWEERQEALGESVHDAKVQSNRVGEPQEEEKGIHEEKQTQRR